MLFMPIHRITYRPLRLRLGGVLLDGTLSIPAQSRGLIVIPNGSGDTTYTPSSDQLAAHLRHEGFATLSIDLLSREEAIADAETAELRFDLPLVASRLLDVSEWVIAEPWMRGNTYGYFAAGITGAAALVAAAEHPFRLRAVACRGARTDLAGEALPFIQAPTLLIVGARDTAHLEANKHAVTRLLPGSRLEVIPRGGHLLDDRWEMEHVAACASDWFAGTLTRAPAVACDALTL
jgi:putative phosphoribosyl transferase